MVAAAAPASGQPRHPHAIPSPRNNEVGLKAKAKAEGGAVDTSVVIGGAFDGIIRGGTGAVTMATSTTTTTAMVPTASPLFVDPGKKRVARVKALLEGRDEGGGGDNKTKTATATPATVMSPRATEIYRRLSLSSPSVSITAARLRRLLLTQYHNVPKLDSGLTAKW